MGVGVAYGEMAHAEGQTVRVLLWRQQRKGTGAGSGGKGYLDQRWVSAVPVDMKIPSLTLFQGICIQSL